VLQNDDIEVGRRRSDQALSDAQVATSPSSQVGDHATSMRWVTTPEHLPRFFLNNKCREMLLSLDYERSSSVVMSIIVCMGYRGRNLFGTPDLQRHAMCSISYMLYIAFVLRLLSFYSYLAILKT